MQSTFFLLSIGFSAGILIQCYFNIPVALGWVGLGISLFFLWVLRGIRHFNLVLVLSFVLLGMIRLQLEAYRPENAIEKFAAPGLTNLSGIVWSQPEIKIKGKKQTVSFVLNSRWVKSKAFHRSEGKVQVFLFNPAVIPVVGDKVWMRGKLEIPRTVTNPGEFDYKKYLAQSDIHSIFTGFGKNSLKIREFKPGLLIRIWQSLEAFRSFLDRRIDQLFAVDSAGKSEIKGQVAPLIKALIIGKRKQLDDELREAFMKTGTAHLLAISGLNVTLVAGTIYAFLIFFKTPQRLAAFFSVLLVISYVFISGASVTVQRAGIMASTAFLAICLDRRHQFFNLFFLAFFTLIWLEPKNLTNLSFQLSFLSVLSLVIFVPGFLQSWHWKETFGHSIAVLIGTLPVVLYYFNLFSPIGLVANLAAIPIFHVSLLSSLGTLIAGNFPLLGSFFIFGAKVMTEIGLSWILWLSKFKNGYYYFQSPPLVLIFIYYFFLVGFWFLKNRPETTRWLLLKRLAGGLCLVLAISFFVPNFRRHDFKLTLLEAGKNELLHLEFPSGHWLVNSGRNFPSDQGRWLVAPFLRHHGINRIEGIILTDFYKRHTGGVPTVLRNVKIKTVFYPPGEGFSNGLHEWKKSRIRFQSLSLGGEVLTQENYQIRILGFMRQQAVLWITCYGWNFLVLPAMDQETLQCLASVAATIRHAHVLILPASRSSDEQSSQLFLEALMDYMDPDIAVSPQRAANYEIFFKDRDIRFFNAQDSGALSFSLTSIESKNQKNNNREPWLVAESFLHGFLARIPQFHR